MSSKASMQFMVPAESKRRLIEELGYHSDEVAVMDPSLAMSVLSKGLKRPFGDKPMPEKWKSKAYQKGSPAGGSGPNKALVAVVAAAVVGLGGYAVWISGAEDRKRQAARQRLIERRNSFAKRS